MSENIILDGRGALLYAGTGIGTYTQQLLLHLPAERYIPLLPGEDFFDYDFRKDGFYGDTEAYRRQIFLPRYLQRHRADLFHVPQNGIGLPTEKYCKEVVTVHDLIPYYYPETVGKGYLKTFLKEMPEILRRSDAVITVSQYSREAILRLFPECAGKIKVIPEAPDPRFRRLPQEETTEVLAQYGLESGKYILYVGGFGPRKNVKALILAYYLWQKQTKASHLLVLPGKRGHEGDETEQLSEALQIRDKIIFPGYLNPEILCRLYNGAAVTVYPSICEGFGLPPLESMACGTPVIAAKSSSLPEVLGDAALYFNPYDSTELAEQLHRVLASATLRQTLAEKGVKNAARYSWEKVASATLAVYSEVLNAT